MELEQIRGPELACGAREARHQQNRDRILTRTYTPTRCARMHAPFFSKLLAKISASESCFRGFLSDGPIEATVSPMSLAGLSGGLSGARSKEAADSSGVRGSLGLVVGCGGRLWRCLWRAPGSTCGHHGTRF